MSVHNLNLVLTVMTQGSFKFSNSIYHEHLKTQLSHHFSLPTAEKPLFLQHAIMLLQRRNLLILPCDYKKKFEHWNPIAESCFMAVFMMILNKLMLFSFGRRKWQPTPVFLPGESQGQRSLVGCCLWGHTELDTTEVT